VIEEVDFHIPELEAMKNYPKKLYTLGNKHLLDAKKVSIVGSRHANQYAKELTYQLSRKLAMSGIVVVSGGAIGIDTVAHTAAGADATIMVAATGLDKRYPAINKGLIQAIEERGLLLSQFEIKTSSYKYNFVLRNELVVALGEVLVVAYADENSGTMRSVEYAKKMGKKIYVLPHRLFESRATNELLANKEAQAIYDIDKFVEELAGVQYSQKGDAVTSEDKFLLFCQKNPSYEEAVAKFPKRVFEAELLGEIEILDGYIRVST
jgi:DNA processing protein